MQDTLAAAATANCYSEGLKKVSGHPRLYRRGAVYYHRAAVPTDIRATYGKREELKSLRTKDRAEALRKVRIVALEVDNRFEAHRRQLGKRESLPVLEDLSEEQLRSIRAIYQAHLLAEDADVRLDGFYDPEEPLPDLPTPSFEDYGAQISEMEQGAKHLLARGKADSFFKDEAEEVLQWSNINLKVAPGSSGFKKVVRALQEAMVMASADIEKRSAGEVVDTPVVGGAIAEQLITTPLMSQAVEDWIKEKRADEWATNTEKEHRVWIGHFMGLCGDRSLNDYRKEDARRFKTTLLQLPPNWTKKADLKNLTIADAADHAHRLGLQPMSTTNINKILRFVGSFWSWSEGNFEESPKGLFDGLSISQKKRRARDDRSPFTGDDLRKIFSSPLYSGCVSAKDWKTPGKVIPSSAGIYWVPLIGLFTGARLGEIIQLYVEDIHTEYGFPCISINDTGPDKSLKTSNAKRDIPIHPELIRLGFLEHVEMRRGEGSKRIFPDLKKGGNNTYSGPFSKHFKRYLEAAGVTTPKTSFHSFRHNFEDVCRSSKVPMDMVDALQGHAQLGERGRYGWGEGFAQALNDAVQQIVYRDLVIPIGISP